MTITWTKCSERMPNYNSAWIIVRYKPGFEKLMMAWRLIKDDDNEHPYKEWAPYTHEAWAELNKNGYWNDTESASPVTLAVTFLNAGEFLSPTSTPGPCYRAYEKALMQGFSEREATMIGENAYFDNLKSQTSKNERIPVPLCDICGAADAVTTENNYFVCSETCDHEARNRRPRN